VTKAKSKSAATGTGGADALINSGEVRRRLGGISSMSLWRWTQRKIVPPPRQINGRNYWRASDIDAVTSGGQEVDRGA